MVRRRVNCEKISVVSGTIDFLRKLWPSAASDARARLGKRPGGLLS